MRLWTPRIMKTCATVMGLMCYVALAQGWAHGGSPMQQDDLEQWGKIIERLGFCLVGFGILAYMMYRQSALEGITKQYDETQQAHLQAFKDINEAYRVMIKETKDTILLSVQVQSTLLAKVEAMEARHGK
ncbi:MAG: hypothetical protein NTAFB01_13300 [Nitrospira sp.]